MSGADTYRALIGLRAIRDYRPEPISDDDIEAVVEAARWTGSSKNQQRWRFVVIESSEQRNRLAACGDFTDPLRNAPLAVALVQTTGGYEFDIGRAAQNLMLAAATRGVASCPITLHRESDAAEVLGLPDGHRCRYAVSLGYPAEHAAPAKFGGRQPQDEVVSRDRFDSAG